MLRAVDVLTAASQVEVVHVEEDLKVGLHQHEPLLNDAHLVLSRLPRVREEEVEPARLARLGGGKVVVGGDAQPMRLKAAHLAHALHVLPYAVDKQREGEGTAERGDDDAKEVL